MKKEKKEKRPSLQLRKPWIDFSPIEKKDLRGKKLNLKRISGSIPMGSEKQELHSEPKNGLPMKKYPGAKGETYGTKGVQPVGKRRGMLK